MKVFLHLFARRFSPSFGWHQFRNPAVSFGTKLLAVFLGVLLTGVLIMCEVPLEAALAVLLPGAGVVLDFALDGLEVLIVPTLLSCAILCALSTNRHGAILPR